MPRINVNGPSIADLVRSCGGQITAFTVADMEAAEKMMQLHLAKFSKALQGKHWADASAALRALEGESRHAQAIASDFTRQHQVETRFAEQLSAKAIKGRRWS